MLDGRRWRLSSSLFPSPDLVHSLGVCQRCFMHNASYAGEETGSAWAKPIRIGNNNKYKIKSGTNKKKKEQRPAQCAGL